MANVGNWIGELTFTTGTGPMTLAGQLPGFTTFDSISETEFWYAIIDGDNRESGIGDLSGGVLARTTVLATLNSGIFDDSAPSPLPLSGAAQVYCTFNRGAFDEFNSHLSDVGNPHGVDQAQVGLGNVDNVADIDKPISTDTQNALDQKADQASLSAHIGDQNNPHVVDAGDVGLSNVDDTSDADKPVSIAQQAALDLKVEEAPENGTGYVRLDAGWVPEGAGGFDPSSPPPIGDVAPNTGAFTATDLSGNATHSTGQNRNKQNVFITEIDCNLGHVFTLTVTANIVITIINPPPAGTDSFLTLILNAAGDFVITWPASVFWPDGGGIPDFSSEEDVVTLVQYDNGVRWRGNAILDIPS